VLTALVVDAEISDGSPQVRASVRSLAVELGMNKDTVARAMVRLRHARLVTASDSGPFQPGVYRLTVAVDVLSLSNVSPAVATHRPPRSHRHPTASGTQLTLLAAE
jgi:DNA-binding IclR family transcriptional regulator